MKKIGIVTITSGANYGNRLQNYAMQKTLNKLGYDAYTIRKQNEKITVKSKIKKIIKHVTGYRYTSLDKRIEKFEKFNEKYIMFSKKNIESDKYSKNLCNEFDAFICGSDQIWNPNYKMNTGCHFLSFVKQKKKIAVSASFGVKEISEESEKQISGWINELDAISVREQSGKQICKKITEKKVEVIIDPTLTLNADEWVEISNKPKGIKQSNYILCYFLGDKNEKFITELINYAESVGKKIIFLEDIWRKLNITSDEEFCYGPSEFVWLLGNSDMVITDSFHAVVFSIIFKRKFLVVPRGEIHNDMNSRFESLFEMFNITGAIYNNIDRFDNKLDIDYEKVESILSEEKNKFYEFIQANI